MKIDLTQEQYEALLKMVYLGGWVASSPQEEPDEEYDAIEQHILSYAKDFGMDKYVTFDAKMKTYIPTEEFEKRTDIVDVLDAYNEYTVWEALILSLARRDLIKKHGPGIVEKMSDEELLEKEYPFIQKYEEEFSEHGFDNLYVKTRK
ncbi:MAG: hypothetical protein A4E62_01154 [Syntrophorhabdus sp. PtaU1.Bin002]|nr:MAG: hypothetical protein A4E58_01771 [Syntrophorhabdus sp. PtaB.Bin006]OPY71693.1 MAG: hypothetical protein A4E62_01154 [Syntrophorhabdus sp. PtaU1.Bin002]